jgi:hypothetical protein
MEVLIPYPFPKCSSPQVLDQPGNRMKIALSLENKPHGDVKRVKTT